MRINRLCIILGLALGMGCSVWKFSYAEQANKPMDFHQSMIKDHTTRKLAKKININDITELRFYGIHMNTFENNPIIVKNRKVVYTFLHALRNSYNRHLELANRVDTLEIHLKKSKGHPNVHTPIILNFNLKNTVDCFGPEFQKAALALSKTRKPLN